METAIRNNVRGSLGLLEELFLGVGVAGVDQRRQRRRGRHGGDRRHRREHRFPLRGLHLPEYREEEGDEDEGGAGHPPPGHGVLKQHRAEDDGEDLPGGHDDGENHGPKPADREEDGDLPRGAGDGGGNVVPQRGGVVGHEFDHFGDVAGEDERGRGEDDGGAVDAVPGREGEREREV